jgi:hypothetical protein
MQIRKIVGMDVNKIQINICYFIVKQKKLPSFWKVSILSSTLALYCSSKPERKKNIRN